MKTTTKIMIGMLAATALFILAFFLTIKATETPRQPRHIPYDGPRPSREVVYPEAVDTVCAVAVDEEIDYIDDCEEEEGLHETYHK